MNTLVNILANSQQSIVNLTRISIFVVMAWIGGLKVYQYEADGIVPFVINSPFMSFFYNNAEKNVIDDTGKEVAAYTVHKNPEGKTVQKNIDWHKENGTYLFSYGLGSVIVLIGLTVLLGIWFPRTGLIGGLLTFGMSIVTLSFLATTPEVYVPNLGGDFPTPQYGFPYLSGAGRLVVKDIIMLGAGLLVASDSAKRIIRGNRNLTTNFRNNTTLTLK